MARETKTFQIFRTGTHVDAGGNSHQFTTQDLSQLAGAYQPALWTAPLVLGHPEMNAPSYGSVTSLFLVGDLLYANAEVDDTLVAWVRDGRYTSVSPAIYAVNAPGNPTPGALNLRHVGFLGAHPPAVKGMEALKFGEHPGVRDALVKDAMRRAGTAYAEGNAFNANPLVADAEARRLRALRPSLRIGDLLYSVTQ